MRAHVFGERRAVGGQPQKNEAAARIHGKRLEPGILTIKRAETTAIRNPRNLTRRAVFPAVILAGELVAVAPSQFGKQTMAVGADIQVGVEFALMPSNLDRSAKEFQRFEIPVAPKFVEQRYRVPGGEEQSVEFGLEKGRRCVVFRPQHILELFLVDEHSDDGTSRQRAGQTCEWPQEKGRS